jgi:hypothetical protein
LGALKYEVGVAKDFETTMSHQLKQTRFIIGKKGI